MSKPTGTKLTRTKSAASTNATSLCATPSQMVSLTACNTAAYAVFVKFYDKALAPTVGTDVPIATIAIPATSSVSLTHLSWWFTLGLAFALTKNAPDTDTTALVAGDLLLTTEHKP